MYCFEVLEAKSPKSKVWQDHTLPKALEEDHFLPLSSFWQLPATLTFLALQLYHSVLWLSHHMAFSLCAILCVSCPLIRIPVILA